MDFRIADTFLDSLARLTGDEQKAVKTTAFDLQVDPMNPGMQMHKLDRAKDKRFWSVRVGRDIRLIVHRTQSSLLLCYTGHHDDAYGWAERRKLETHPTTGAAQLVEIRELVREIAVPVARAAPVVAAAPDPRPPILRDISDDELLALGVPAEWIADVRGADEDGLLEVASHLPAEAAEAVLELAVGGTPRPRQPVAAAIASRTEPEPRAIAPSAEEIAPSAFEHPDAQRRFRTISDAEELERALTYPWDRWTVFLHPSQRELVERDFAGPARVSGGAGTGKTIVALHRAVRLAKQDPDARVLLTTFAKPLAAALRMQLRRLVSDAPRLGERLEVHALDEIALRLHTLTLGPPQLASREDVLNALEGAFQSIRPERIGLPFLVVEWDDVVDAWQIETEEAYRALPRLGRRTRLPDEQRGVVWTVLRGALDRLEATGRTTMAGVYTRLAASYRGGHPRPFDHVLVDEAQDLTVAQLRLVGSLEGDRPNGLFFAGDLGQRIFPTPFSWTSLGVDVRGRSETLRVSYRMSQQIRAATDRLLPKEIADVDGNVESRAGAVSAFSGAEPEVAVAADERAEIEAVGRWLGERRGEGYAPHELGVFVRSVEQADRAIAALVEARVPYVMLDERLITRSGFASLATMHLAKGLEFRAVAVMACDDEILPLQERISSVTDPADLEEAYNAERHLLYVAASRARDRLLVTGVRPGSEFLDDLSRGEWRNVRARGRGS